MNQLIAALKAREFIRELELNEVPVPIKAYAEHVGAKIRTDFDLADDESGFTMRFGSRIQIHVNGNHRRERQRFTICHELGHIVLGLPTEHETCSWWSYRQRPMNEVYCDIFAAELLLPLRTFKPRLNSDKFGFDQVSELAGQFQASLPCTASRYASAIDVPCAYVLSENGRVRFVERSTKLRQAGAWIGIRGELPPDSISARVREGSALPELTEISADEWFDGWGSEFSVFEDAKHLAQWDQTLSLLWLDEDICDEQVERVSSGGHQGAEDMGLQELDGILPWPGKRRRR